MRFVFGYAGIPSEFYDDVFKVRSSFAGNNVVFEGFPLKNFEPKLTKKHAVQMLNRICDVLGRESREGRREVACCVIYVKPLEGDISDFEHIFFPSTLVYPVFWTPQYGSKGIERQSKNDLVGRLRDATEKSKKALFELRKEVVEKAQRTPLLLPLRNFKSDFLVSHLKDLQCKVVDSQVPDEVIREVVSSFERRHPPIKVGGRNKPCFIDDSKLEFHSPGKALHGLPRARDGHGVECFLGGVRRLGAPYNQAFHYDCIRGERKLKGDFHGCHGEEKYLIEGDPHLNIAPNDFVRA